jgi:hypothetical protein
VERTITRTSCEKHEMVAMVILQLAAEPIVGGTEDDDVRLGGCNSNHAIRNSELLMYT